MKSFLILGAFVSLVASSAACSSTSLSVGADPKDGGGTNPEGGGGNGTCSKDADCGGAGMCGFLEKDACSAHGTCFPRPDVTCTAFALGCGCDGTTFNTICSGLPTGYVLKPLAHAGACPDGGGGSGACTGDKDCGPSGLCGFAKTEACQAHGKCFPAPDGICDAYGPGCACDGTTINIICNGLPDGYTPKPLLATGECKDGGPPPSECTHDADCKGGLCGFNAKDACSAKGKCFPDPGAICGAFMAGCACDGTDVNMVCNGLPQGYDPKPLAHEGKCTDGGL